MSILKNFWQYAFSPRLFKIFDINSNRIIDRSYEPYKLEKWGDQIIITFATIWSVRFCAIPLLLIYSYRRNSPESDLLIMSKFMFGAGVILITSYIVRGYSRANNDTYKKFFKVLSEARARLNNETKQELQKYDFEFYAWPVEYKAVKRVNKNFDERQATRHSDTRTRRLGNKDQLFAIPCKIASYITAHTIALPLIYPGCITYLNWMIGPTLLQGRVDLIKQGAERFKLFTADHNEIDSIFIDRRKNSANGKILVITCEGNCGFYEAGIIFTPINKGYSVLGWNHPGFANSTGAPYPDQEENGINCIMEFAINKLGFKEEEIIVYGWSIGGYPATFAAMNYPKIQSLILDATFDDLLPLATMRMPSFLDNLVRNVIRGYFNLNVAEQLNRYDGRVLIIRRTEDEIICAPQINLAGNRGNKLLSKMLARRYPHIFLDDSDCSTLLSMYLTLSTPVFNKIVAEETTFDDNDCIEVIRNEIIGNGNVVKYPSSLGEKLDKSLKRKLTLFLATKYLEDQCSQHCTPLAPELFHPAWDPLSTLNNH